MSRRTFIPTSLLGPLIGTILFLLLVPGTVVGWVPYRLSGWTFAPPLVAEGNWRDVDGSITG
jgi:hypothetical protein